MNDAHSLVYAALIALAVLALLVLKRLAAGGRRYPAGALPYESRGHLLSRGELAFFHVLRGALPPGLMVAPKVRVSDVLKCDAAAWKQGFGGRISQKHVDFVVVDARTTEFVLVIELDDRTHHQRDRRDRDDFIDRAFSAAGVEVLHVRAAASYDVARMRATLAERLAVATAHG
jgi:hypothetical protein